MTDEAPRISIIICTCNRAEHLRLTLASMAGVLVPETMPTELIVVDNGSTDNTAEVVQQCQLPNMPVRYVHEPKRGLCYARNAGMVAAQGEVFLWTDDDLRLPTGWIAGMCGPILRGEAEAVAGAVTLAPHLERGWMQSIHRDWLATTTFTNVQKAGGLVGANMAFDKRVLEDVPAFDLELGSGSLGFFEETLFSWQLMQAGFRVIAAPGEVAEHHCGEERLRQASYYQTAEKMGRSTAYVAHHWLHARVTFPHLRLLRWHAQFRASQWKNRQGEQIEGGSTQELTALEKIYFYRQHLIERKRPRNYEKRGLIKHKGTDAL